MNDDGHFHELLEEQMRLLAEELQRADLKIVFAESCTAGLLSASLSVIPGISSYLCGSFVTYRNESKAEWLGVNRDDLVDEKIGPVSETVALQMAASSLERTSEAEIAVSVTGHLGPEAPELLDGIVYTAIAVRSGEPMQVVRIILEATAPDPIRLRRVRQLETATRVIRVVRAQLKNI